MAQSGTERGGKIGRVSADFDLFDDAANVPMLVFDGIFDDDDVAGFAIINFVDERGHRGGLAGARCAAEEHEAARKPGEIFDGGRKMKFLERRHFGGERARRALMLGRPTC